MLSWVATLIIPSWLMWVWYFLNKKVFKFPLNFWWNFSGAHCQTFWWHATRGIPFDWKLNPAWLFQTLEIGWGIQRGNGLQECLAWLGGSVGRASTFSGYPAALQAPSNCHCLKTFGLLHKAFHSQHKWCEPVACNSLNKIEHFFWGNCLSFDLYVTKFESLPVRIPALILLS